MVVLLGLNLLSCSVRTVRSFARQPAAPRLAFFDATTTTALRQSTSAAAAQGETTKKQEKPPVPVTLLAGFLGTGKTTTLKHLLENTDNVKIGVIVNDVASVNIDAKLIAQGGTGAGGLDDMVELQNGCACCSLADELFFSVEKLLTNRNFDALVIELSGVADPMAIRNNWKMAPLEIRQMAEIFKVVTVIDSQTFGSDYMTWDMVVDRKDWVNAEAGATCSNQKVSQLLAEQVEAADVVLLNKVDLAGADQVQLAGKIAKALNEKAELVPVEFGKVSPQQLLLVQQDEAVEPESSHSHSHDHHAEKASSSSHSHSHDHAAKESSSSSHSHSHDHACSDPDCTDSSHSHSHDHACSDPDCTDESHSHSHHSHAASSHETSTEALGIRNFVYKATRPFSTQRVLMLLNQWPVPKKDVLDAEFLQDFSDEDAVDMFGRRLSENPFNGVLRSKGFCWFAPQHWGLQNEYLDDTWRHDTAMYLSHAGRHMSVDAAGKWWATVPEHNLPKFFEEDNQAELERILRDDFVTDEFGDRRQELVFIGVDLNEVAIRQALDQCLLTDDEMEGYRENLQALDDRRMAWVQQQQQP